MCQVVRFFDAECRMLVDILSIFLVKVILNSVPTVGS